ncbi:trimeric intracellular cation channel family protein [Nevskia sp.]|uniref:trimeric intracellular cation channel family protein n=1 Tax=Nevskia sp. TaxID=1929292 RepID=UPI0025CD7AB2|nr:trimeric intracellular cation channel family protein [Nevskia sp.]
MILQLLDYAGAAVFAISGALAAGRKSLDMLGVVVIALVTATGGGTIRDLLLDRNPVFWIGDPLYVVVIIVAALATIPYTRWMRPPLQMLQIADALGLAFFSIAGAQVAITAGHGGLIAVIMATITGSFGGLLRDVLCNEIPMILRKGQLYGVAVIAGASVYVLALEIGLTRWPATIIGMLVIVAFRGGAIVWNWSLPVYSLPDAPDRSRD